MIDMTSVTGLDLRWKALAARDRAADGTFVYAVTSTGVYCRPSCPSRRPRADRVRFFDTTHDARQAGFRACKRCRPDTVGLGQPGIEAVRRVSAYLATHADETVTLGHLSRIASMSPHHLQRRFKAIVGLSPREFLTAFSQEHPGGRGLAREACIRFSVGSPPRGCAAVSCPTAWHTPGCCRVKNVAFRACTTRLAMVVAEDIACALVPPICVSLIRLVVS